MTADCSYLTFPVPCVMLYIMNNPRDLTLRTFTPRLFHIAGTRIERGEQISLHSHRDFCEIFWIEEGEGEYQCPDLFTPLREGNLVFVRARDIHGFRTASRLSITNLAFPEEHLIRLLEEYAPSLLQEYRSAPVSPRRDLTPRMMNRLETQAAELFYRPREPVYLSAFLLNLLSELQLAEALKESGIPRWLEQACREIREKEKFEGGTAEFFRLTGKNAEYVSRCCRRYYGRTPGEIVTDARMDFAATELLFTDREITDIALDCGLESLSYFYKIFRNRFGQAPGGFRNQSRIQEPPRERTDP